MISRFCIVVPSFSKFILRTILINYMIGMSSGKEGGAMTKRYDTVFRTSQQYKSLKKLDLLMLEAEIDIMGILVKAAEIR